MPASGQKRSYDFYSKTEDLQGNTWILQNLLLRGSMDPG